MFKTAQFLFVSMALVSVSAQAMPERECKNQVLNCRLEVSGESGKTLADRASAKFSGINEDEPSIMPDSCTLRAELSDRAGNDFLVSLSDSDYYLDVYVSRMESGTMTGKAQTAFRVVPNKPFVVSYGNDTLTCVLAE